MKRLIIAMIGLLAATSCWFCFTTGCQNRQSTTPSPKLILLISVDQMRADHLTRFAPLYQHGLAKLLNEGTVFSNAHQDHAITVTGAGHATIATACFPSRHGIVSNDWIDRQSTQKVYCAEDSASPLLGYPEEDPAKGRSPAQLLVSSLGDWLKERYPESRVSGVARKDRAAILTTGRRAEGVYWYHDRDGNMVTSEYYRKSYPPWVEAFNRSRAVDRYYNREWRKLKPDTLYTLAREDGFEAEADGGESSTFPHRLSGPAATPDRKYYQALTDTPFFEELILEFAKNLVENEQLGSDASPDLLFLGCSTADAIGHRYGPFSQECLDYYLRLDQYLEDFFNYLDQRIGENGYLVVLTSDHGVVAIPEVLSREGYPARRIPETEAEAAMRKAFAKFHKDFGVTDNLIIGKKAGGFYLNAAAAAARGISSIELEETLAEHLKTIDFVEAVYPRNELLRSITPDPFWGLFRRSFHPARSPDVMIRLKKYHLIHKKGGTSHGSAYEYDTHIPLIFMGPGIPAGTCQEKVRAVDIAPTLAEILNISPANEIDGVSLLQQMIRRD